MYIDTQDATRTRNRKRLQESLDRLVAVVDEQIEVTREFRRVTGVLKTEIRKLGHTMETYDKSISKVSVDPLRAALDRTVEICS